MVGLGTYRDYTIYQGDRSGHGARSEIFLPVRRPRRLNKNLTFPARSLYPVKEAELHQVLVALALVAFLLAGAESWDWGWRTWRQSNFQTENHLLELVVDSRQPAQYQEQILVVLLAG